MKLEFDSTTPLYQQLKETIKNEVVNKTYKQGQKIPTEIELSKIFGVSRITVRKAIEALCDEGYLIKKQGKGTFVRRKKIQRKIEHLVSFSEACKLNNMTPSAVVLVKQIIELSPTIAEAFNMPIGKKMVEINRLRKADDIPVMLEQIYFDYDQFSFLLEENLGGLLYELLEKEYGITINATKNTYLDVVKADLKRAELLEVDFGEPLFCIHAKIYDQHDNLVHLATEYTVCDCYRYALTDYYIDKSK
ncbi:MAG: GntR family transcriptional regulator [Clostridiales bacterium]|nr:GntR family transcriptional regulator [Clostridiales bacterium]